jgi:hypothetical protein
MWPFITALLVLVVLSVVPYTRRCIKRNKEFWQFIAAIGTLVVLYFGFQSLKLTRELFELQNRPHIDISTVLGNYDYYPGENHSYLSASVVFINSGNLPAKICSTKFKFNYLDFILDSSYAIGAKVYPNMEEHRELVFNKEEVLRFSQTVYDSINNNPASSMNLYSYEFNVYYKCEQLDLQDSARSVWKHPRGNNSLIQIE